MKTNTKQKLKLNRETVRILKDSALSHAAGGTYNLSAITECTYCVDLSGNWGTCECGGGGGGSAPSRGRPCPM